MDQVELTKEEIVKFGNTTGHFCSKPESIIQGSCYVLPGSVTAHAILKQGRLLITRQKNHLVYPSDVRDHVIIRDKEVPDACLSWVDR